MTIRSQARIISIKTASTIDENSTLKWSRIEITPVISEGAELPAQFLLFLADANSRSELSERKAGLR